MLFDDFDKCMVGTHLTIFLFVKKKVIIGVKISSSHLDGTTFSLSSKFHNRRKKRMGFRWKKCQSKIQVLTERAHIVLGNHKYLVEIHFR